MIDAARSQDNQYTPQSVSPPGGTLADLLEERGLSQRDLARRMGRPVKTINEIVKGKTAITQDTALELELALGVPASFWNNRELRYREHLARADQLRHLKKLTPWVRRFPVSEMARLDWIAPSTRPEQRAHDLLQFFGVASPEQWHAVYEQPQASFRRSSKVKRDAARISAWLRRGELQALAIRAAAYDEGRFRSALRDVRALTREASPTVFVPRLQETFASAGVVVVFTPELKGCGISGATRWLPSGHPLIQLSLRYKTDDHLWFTVFHEAAHVLLHPKRAVFIESPQRDDSTEENEADRFAATTLINDADYARLVGAGIPSLDSIRTFAEDIGVAAGIVVGRLQHEGVYGFHAGNGLKQRFTWSHEGTG